MSDDKLVQLGSVGTSPALPPPTFEIDPVCKMKVLPQTAAGHYDYQGKTYYFCATRCLERFRANPEQFLGARPKPVETKSSITYTCPMHPEVRQQGPGSCPKCGMALEPEMVTAGEEENPELVDMTRRFRIAVVFTLPVLTLAMAESFNEFVFSSIGGVPRVHWIQFLLATPVVL
jgi:Cu+-exporting ATPase